MDYSTIDFTGLSLKQAALQIALTQLGQSETPGKDNCGPMVDKYLADVGLNPGYAWCQAFVHWCYDEAAKQLNVPCPVPHTAGVLACWNMADVNSKLLQTQLINRTDLVEPGDQVILDYGKGMGHTCIVESVEGNILHTIEGNSNENGSRQGYEVCRHTRDVSGPLFKGIIKYS